MKKVRVYTEKERLRTITELSPREAHQFLKTKFFHNFNLSCLCNIFKDEIILKIDIFPHLDQHKWHLWMQGKSKLPNELFEVYLESPREMPFNLGIIKIEDDSLIVSKNDYRSLTFKKEYFDTFEKEIKKAFDVKKIKYTS